MVSNRTLWDAGELEAYATVVVTCALRTPLCKARKGSYKDATSNDLLLATFTAARENIGIDPSIIGDM